MKVIVVMIGMLGIAAAVEHLKTPMKVLPLIDDNIIVSNVTFKCQYATGKDPNNLTKAEKEVDVTQAKAELALEFPARGRGKIHSLRALLEFKQVSVGDSVTVDHPAGKFTYKFDREKLPYFTMELIGPKGGVVMKIDSMGLVNAPVIKLHKELGLLLEDQHETLLPTKYNRSMALSVSDPKKFPRKIFKHPTTISCEVADEKAQFRDPQTPFDPDQLLQDEQK